MRKSKCASPGSVLWNWQGHLRSGGHRESSQGAGRKPIEAIQAPQSRRQQALVARRVVVKKRWPHRSGAISRHPNFLGSLVHDDALASAGYQPVEPCSLEAKAKPACKKPRRADAAPMMCCLPFAMRPDRASATAHHPGQSSCSRAGSVLIAQLGWRLAPFTCHRRPITTRSADCSTASLLLAS